MPTYQNNGEALATPQGLRSLRPGESIRLRKYLADLPDGVELISHEPRCRPVELLYSGSVPTETISVYAYAGVMLFNGTDAAAKFVPNEDAEHWMALPAGGMAVIDTINEWHNVQITEAGAGDVAIWGLVRTGKMR